MKKLLVILALVVACSAEPVAPPAPPLEDPDAVKTATLEVFHNRAEREAGPIYLAADYPPHAHVLVFGICFICARNKSYTRPPADTTGTTPWTAYNPVPTVWFQPGTNQQ